MAKSKKDTRSRPQGGAKDMGADRMPLTVWNYKMMLVGFAAIVLGFVLMTGGGSSDPSEFNYDMFSFRRITLAPVLVLAGFAFEIYAIMKKPGAKQKQQKQKQ